MEPTAANKLGRTPNQYLKTACKYRSPGTEAAIRGGRMAGLVASGLVRRPATIRYVPDTRLQRLREAPDPQGSVARTVTAASAIADTSHRTDRGHLASRPTSVTQGRIHSERPH